MTTTVEIKSERTGYCRICQCYEDENMFDMLQGFKEVMGNEDKLQFTCEAFTRTTGIKLSPDEQSSRFVCKNCFNSLKDFLLLRQEAEASRQKFSEIQNLPRIDLKTHLKEIKVEGEETQQQCLICMGYDDEMTDIFSDIQFEVDIGNVNKLSHLFEEVVGISPSDYDRGDKLLCGGCVNSLKRSGFFRHQTLKTDENAIEESSTKYMIEIKQENFNCQICHKAFTDQLEYESHLPCTCQTNSYLLYKCLVCKKSFNHNYKLQEHMLDHSNEPSHVCNICSKSFRFQIDFKHHLQAHSIDRTYACKLCPKTHKTPDTLKKHFRTHNDNKEFVCEICSKPCKHFWNLKEHLKTHSSDRPFVCQVCSKSFIYSSALTAHMNVHGAINPYQCPRCPKTFFNPRSLRLHVVCHKNNRVEICAKSYVCEICAKTFKHASSLRTHKTRNHSDKDSLSYECKFCSEIFPSKNDFINHIPLHSSEGK